MAKTMIKYEDGSEWNQTLVPDELKSYFARPGTYDAYDCFYNLVDKDGNTQVSVKYEIKEDYISNMSFLNKDDKCIPMVEDFVNQLNPGHISNVDYAISEDGIYYVGMDSIKQASENSIRLDKVYMKESFAISKEGKLYVGDEEIKHAYMNNVKFDDIRIKENEYCDYVDYVYALAEDGTLYINGDDIKNIPDDVVLKYVFIADCDISEWNHKVTRTFYAHYTPLETIGPNAEFGGYVIIRNTPLSDKIGMYVIETPEEKKAFMDAIKSMDSKQEPEQTPEPEEEYSMKM
ncbi:hypothetical protein [Komagataeibacter nataicola]|uniref:DKNYY domain-containing protein n=2 Tax=Komagataeibacter nataicola TaxID=265960 RepID=A0ABX5PD86_9PROT|nr:hypothetical protein [Komagataeibacter nataicola]PYD66296.1 hypothetical protein CDI09_09110 [Komagataeibacter nataicola]WNM10339.1 hypothetical protein RI056_18740 [Komagataeibacter nataicola]GBR23572.1 hypothetical protein AA0616_2557 [Komagataeibacter nataicola NRIC 0616]